MPTNPLALHIYTLPGGEKVFTQNGSTLLEKISSTRGNILRKFEQKSYKKKMINRFYDKWSQELREAATGYYQCVLQIKELFRLQNSGEPPRDKSITLVKRLSIKRSNPRLQVSPPPEAKTPRSRIPVSTRRRAENSRSASRAPEPKRIPRFLKHERPSPPPPPFYRGQPSTPTAQRFWGASRGRASGRFSGSEGNRRPRTAPNERALMNSMHEDIKKRLNFKAV